MVLVGLEGREEKIFYFRYVNFEMSTSGYVK